MAKPENEADVPGGELTTPGPDCWTALSRFTSARIALGRAGGSWRTEPLLDFRLAHALARDAVGKSFDADALETQLRQLACETVRLTTEAGDHSVFLKRPDLGRKLSTPSRQLLTERAGWRGRKLAIIVSDGLSALAAERQAVPTLAALLPVLHKAGWTFCPVFVAPFARVKLQDEIGALLQPRLTLALLGERPGLGSPDSLGAYFTYEPGPEKTDADRNCVSNIRPQGLPPAEAGLKLGRLLMESAQQRTSGIHLKELPLATLITR
jgi:ethanolamine ammonia-lyase small subunit